MKKAVAYLIPFIEQEKARRPEPGDAEGHQRHHRHGDRQGRRPRHRQEHRRRRAPVQQLRGHRPRRHGAGAEDPRRGEGARGRHHRAVGPHHALARRDGELRRRDAAPGPDDPAAHRRGDDLARAHRRQGRQALRRAGRLGQGRLALRPGGRRAAERRAAPGLLAKVEADYDSLRQRHGAKTDRRLLSLEQARERRTPIDWSGYRAAAPAPAAPAGPRRLDDHPVAGLVAARARAARLPAGRAAPLHRLAALLQHLGAQGHLPGDPQQPDERTGRPQALRGRAGDARPHRRRALAARQRRRSASSRPTRSATTSRSMPTSPARPRSRCCAT